MAMPGSSDDNEPPQTEGEGPDGSDKPPYASRNIIKPLINGSSKSNSSNKPVKPINGLSAFPAPPLQNPSILPNPPSVPLPPPDAHAATDKQPGHTRASLQKLAVVISHSSSSGSDHNPTHIQKSRKKRSGSIIQDRGASHPPSTPSSPVPPSPCDSDWYGPSRPPSRPPSRAPSMSAGLSGGKILGFGSSSKKGQPVTDSPAPPRGKPSSIHSDKGDRSDGHKFTLKDLLASAPKLHRRSSQRSTSSRRSDSDAGEMVKGTKSATGDSAVSLTQKYGVCQKVAIGKGATSVVRLAHKWDRSEEKLYAVKEFRKRRKNESEKEYVKKLTAEFCISSTLHHPNVVETVDLVQDEGLHWCEVMEFCPGGDLYAAIKKGGMSPSEVECCFKQILCGVAYLHSQGVAHRDIKPENLFFDSKGNLKIGDYGASTVYRLPWEATVHMSTGLCGSEPYIAPEQFLGKPYDARLVDIWACGIVYYCLHYQELPWRAAQPSADQLYTAYAAACSNPSPAISACPPTINNLNPRQCRPLLRKMLEPDPKQRWTIAEVMAHSWVKSIEVCTEAAQPKHVHVSARAMGQTYEGLLGNH